MGGPAFFFVSTAFTSHSDGEIAPSDKNPYRFLYLKDNNALGLPVNRTVDFPKVFLTDEERWRRTEQQHILRDKVHARTNLLPKQTESRAPSVLLPKPHWKKNKTIWLILNVCLPDHRAACQAGNFCFVSFTSFFFNFRVKRCVQAPEDSVLLNEDLTFTGFLKIFFFSITSTLCAHTGLRALWPLFSQEH